MGVIPLGKLGPCRWEPGPKSLRQLLFSQKSNLKVHTLPATPPLKKRHLHIRGKSWRALDKYIHTSHHCSTHGSLYQHDRRHRETLTELIGHSHLLFPPRGPLTCTQHRRPIKGVIPLWKTALVTKTHKYESVHTHWNVCTNDTLLAQRSNSTNISDLVRTSSQTTARKRVTRTKS